MQPILTNIVKISKQWLQEEKVDFSTNDPKQLIKNLHDLFLQDSNILKCKNEKLIINNMENDQIWEQINLHLNPVEEICQKYIKKIGETKNTKNQVNLDKSSQSEENQDIEEEHDSNLDQEILQDNFIEEEDEQPGKKQKKQKEEKNLDEPENFQDEMNQFLDEADEEDIKYADQLEKKGYIDVQEQGEDSEEIGSEYEFGEDEEVQGKDFFRDDGSEDEGDEQDKQDMDEEPEEEDDGQLENEVFEEQREEKLEQKQDVEEKNPNEDEIDKLEKKLVAGKEWQLRGEVRSKDRPVNSLIESHLDFSSNVKEIEEINQEYQDKLETIIKQRILDEAFDDRVKYVFDQRVKENFINYSQEKSGKGLAEIYEDEFQSQLNLPTASKDDKLKLEIINQFKEVCYKIDLLTNLSFTPKPIIQMAEIKTSTPFVEFEEKIPINVGGLQVQDAKKIFDPKKSHFESKEEMKPEENQAKRLQKKRIQRVRNKEIQQKKMQKHIAYSGQTKQEYKILQQSQVKNKTVEKVKNQSSVKFTKSNQFFQNLQNNQTQKGEKIEKKQKKDQKNFKL